MQRTRHAIEENLSKKYKVTGKRSLGFRPGTHYETMMRNPTLKLQPFLHPEMKALDIKMLVKTLETTDPKQRSQLKKEASDKRRIHALEQERKRKEEIATKRQEAVARRNQLAQENIFFRGLVEEVEYNFADENDFQRM